METHTRSQFSRHLENISQVTIKGRWKCCRIERLVLYKVDPPYQKLICKTLRKYSASNYQSLSNRLDSTRVERLVSVKVDTSLARHLENILQITSKSRWKCCRINSNRTTRHCWCRPVIPEVDLQSTTKFSVRGHERGLQILSNRLDSTRIERLATVD